MAFRNWLARNTEPSQDPKGGRDQVGIDFEIVAGNYTGEAKLAGTTTTSKAGAHAMMVRHAVTESAMVDVTGTVQREPENPVDRDAVAVHVEGERVGYLDRAAREGVDLEKGAIEVPVRAFAALVSGELRVEAWAWIGDDVPAWTYGPQTPPPMTPAEKRIAQHASSRSMVADAVAGGGIRAEHFKAGMVDGVHYLELVEPIKELKRQGRLEDALVLAYKAIEATESAHQEGAMPTFYTEQAAIILRKLGRRDEEIEVLRRWVRKVGSQWRRGAIPDRLAKLEH